MKYNQMSTLQKSSRESTNHGP